MFLYDFSTGWTNDAAGGRAAVRANTAGEVYKYPMPNPGWIRLRLADPAHQVRACVLASDDLLTCYEVGTTSGTGGDLTIRKVTNGTPGAALVTVAHGLTTATPFSLLVRIIRGVIEVRLNGAGSNLTSYDASADTDTIAYNAAGFSSDQTGARVLGMDIGPLTQVIRERAELLWVVGGDGSFWVSTDGVSIGQLQAGGFSAGAPVFGVPIDNKVYLFDGQTCKVFDSQAMTLTTGIPTGGAFPGQTTAGTCTSIAGCEYLHRLALSDGSNVVLSGNLDPLNFAVDGTEGGAFAVPVGEPVRMLHSAAKTRLTIGTPTSLWAMDGDPALGAVENNRVLSAGTQGRDAACNTSTESAAAILTTEGLVVMSPGGYPLNISMEILTEIIQNQDALETRLVTLVRDPRRHLLHLFLTLTSGQTTHLMYDEMGGGYVRGRGGFFPENYPDRIGPTCACYYAGRPILGGRNGVLFTFDDAAKTDDGDKIGSRMALRHLDNSDLTKEPVLCQSDLLLRSDTDAVALAVYGGETAEHAYADPDRITLHPPELVADRRKTLLTTGRAPTIVFELQSAGVGTAWHMEALQVEYQLEPVIEGVIIPPAPPVPCGPTTVIPPAGGPTGGPGEPEPTDPPEECTDCALWMAANTTAEFDVDGDADQELVYTLVDIAFPWVAQDVLAAARGVIDKANLCGLGSNWNIYVAWFGDEPMPPSIWSIDDFLAEDLTVLPYSEYKVRIYFACEIQ